MKNIYCIGEALIDWMTEEKKSLHEVVNFQRMLGGAPFNVAIGIARLGGQVAFGGAVGLDPFGKALKNQLDKEGVVSKHLMMVKQPTTFAFVSHTSEGERDFIFQRGADEHFKCKFPKDIDIIHFGSATAFLGGKLENTYQNFLFKALENGLFISFDPNFRQSLWENRVPEFVNKVIPFIESANFIKLSEEELYLITGINNLNKAVKYFYSESNRVVCVTLGKLGALLIIKNISFIIHGITVKPIDTTGAGDAFVAAVLFQLSENSEHVTNENEWKKIIEKANLIAAVSTTRMGAIESLPFTHELNI